MVAGQRAKQGRSENDGADEKQETDGYDEEEGEGMATVKKEKERKKNDACEEKKKRKEERKRNEMSGLKSSQKYKGG